METNKKITHIIIGLLVGIIATSAVFFLNDKNEARDMSHTMDGMMSALHGKTGDAFDKEFLSQMIVHHEGAVEMAEMVLAVSKRTELRTLANDIISAQTREIDMMKGWQKTWFGETHSGGRYMDIETYVKTEISNLSPVKETVGGKFFVTKIETYDGSGTVEYEDGHNAYTADFTYIVDKHGKPDVTSFKIRGEQNCITSEETSNCAYLTGFEKKSDGYWYLSFDAVWFKDTTIPIGPTNDSPVIHTFKARKDMKVTVDFTEKNNFVDFESYQSKLVKKGRYYFDPIVREDSFLHNGLYEISVENGVIVGMSEGGDFSRPQGT